MMAVITHSGGASSGHYICKSKFLDKWFLHDDGNVSIIDRRDINDFGSSKSRVFLYKAINI